MGVDDDGETGPGVLSGTGQPLVAETGKEAERPRGPDLQVIRNGGWTEHRVIDTPLLSGAISWLSRCKNRGNWPLHTHTPWQHMISTSPTVVSLKYYISVPTFSVLLRLTEGQAIKDSNV